MEIKHLFLLLLLFVQCTSPKAGIFTIDNMGLTAPATIDFYNGSRHAESYEWKVNGEVVGIEKDLRHTFLESGSYELSLHASKGNREDVTLKKIIVQAPEVCRIIIRTTIGNMVFELDEKTPGHLSNIVKLVEDGYYNDLSFHRVIDGFVIQTGDNSTRGETKNFVIKETIPHEINNDMVHYRGVLAAARMPDNINPKKESSATQFYIVHGRNVTRDELINYNDARQIPYRNDQIEQYLKQGGAPQLDFEYTVFGRLIEGFDVLDKIASVNTDQSDKPLEDIRIIEIRAIN